MTDPGSTTAAKAIVPLALGPDSLAWKHAGDNLQLLMAGTILPLLPLKALRKTKSSGQQEHGRIDLAA